MVEFRILGPLEVVADGDRLGLGAVQQRALLAVLVLHRGELLSVDRLIDELWGERAPATAAKTVQVYVSQLRKVLGPGVIMTEGRAYRLVVGPEQVDISRFDLLAGDGRRALAAGDAERARGRLGAALALWRGEPLAEFAYVPFAQRTIAGMQEARMAAVEDRIDADLALGRDGELIGELESLIASNPLQERLRGQLMRVLYRAGRQADALGVYRQTSELLRDELGLEPSPMLQELERAILAQDVSLNGDMAATHGVSALVCPFKGLASFDRADAEFFCGRERLVADLLARSVESPLVGIIGSSGIGKSSLLRGGLLPALSAGALPGSGGWRQVMLRPGPHPHVELSRALDGERLGQALGRLSPAQRLVVAVDQLEELFTLCESEDERSGFLEQLAAAADDPERRALVVTSLRADFYGRFASYSRFAELLSRSHVLVGPMDRDELARAIEQPSARAGLELEPGLAYALISDVAGEPGGLPLLSTTLLELWRGRDGRVLRYDSYRTSGGVRRAVARLAEDTYTQLGETEQQIARDVMLRLASGDDGTLARRPVALGELERAEGTSAVLAQLADARLLTISDGDVELSHEALLREWPRYRSWLEEDRIGRRVHAHLTAAARDWDERGSDVADLYRGARMGAALEWRAGHEQELNETERAFLDASRAAAGRAQRRLRIILAAVAFLLAVAVAGGVVALDQRSSARNEARVAEAQRLGVQALSEPRLDHSLLLARQGVALDRSPATSGYLFEALLRSPAAIRVMDGAGDPLTALDVSPDGRTLAAGDTAGNVLFFNAITGRRAGPPYTAPFAISAVRFSPDAKQLAVATGGGGGFIDIVDARTHRYTSRLFVAPPSGSLATVNISWVLGTIGFSPDSRELWADATYNQLRGSAGYIARWATGSGQRLGPPRQVDRTPQAALAGFIGRGGQLVTSNGAERATVIRDTATLRPVRRLQGGSARAALSPNGRVVALGGADGSVSLLDLQTGNLRIATGRHDAAVTDLRFARDSRTLLTAGADGRVIEWNVADGRRVETFTGHAGTVSQVVIAPDGQTAYSAGQDGTVIAWDLTQDRRLDRPFTAPPRSALVFSPQDRGSNGPTDFAPGGTSESVAELVLAPTPNGRRFAVPDDAGYVDVFDSRMLTRTTRIPMSPGRQVAAVALAPDGRTVAATTGDGQLRFADLRDPRRPGPPQAVANGPVWSLAFSGDGRWLATAGELSSIHPPLQLWDVRRRRLAYTALPSPTTADATDVTLSPDGRELAATTNDGSGTASIEIFSVPALVQLKTLRTDPGTALQFSPDARLLVFGDAQGRVSFYDTRTWRLRGRPILAHTDPVATASFSPDGRVLATTSDDGSTRLWDVPSGRPIGTELPGLGQRYVAAAFVDRGTQLITLNDGGQGYRWDIQPQAWARRACQVSDRTLTRAEWNDALPERSYAPACATR